MKNSMRYLSSSSKKRIAILISMVLIMTMAVPSAFAEDAKSTVNTSNIAVQTNAGLTASQSDISIVYTGDIHGDVTGGLSLSGVKAYGNSLKDEGKYVEYVDLGDALSGTVLSSISKGEYAVEALNIAGYGVAVPGVHEFDYGISRFITVLQSQADYKYVSCNVFNTSTSERIFRPYVIKTYGNVKVAFVGITNPDTMSESTVSFQNPDGSDMFSFCQGSSGSALYAAVQDAINSAKYDGADYIIAVGNLPENGTAAYAPAQIIRNTSGINAFINGYTHSSRAYQAAYDKDNNPAIITNPGAEIKNIGVMTISPLSNTISTQLISSYNYRDVTVKDGIEKLNTTYSAELKTAFATSTSKLIASNTSGVRIIEAEETNLGDLVADAYKTVLGTDVALVDASEIATNIALGSVSYNDIMKAIPNGDGISVIKVSGLDIMDALEMSVRKYPSRNTDFLQTAGITYDINETVLTSVSLGADGSFNAVKGDYRVTNILINGKPIDLLGTYTLAASNSLIDGMTGYTMFRSAPAVKLNATTDAMAVITYITKNLASTVGSQYAGSQGRVDVIKLARQSEIDAEVDKKVEAKVKDYATQVKELKEQLEIQEKVIAVKSLTVTASSSFSKIAGKRTMTVTWKTTDDIDGVKYQVYKSSKKSSGYKKIISTSKKTCSNSSGLTKGNKYYYKVRAYLYIGGKYYYSNWSNVTYKTVTK